MNQTNQAQPTEQERTIVISPESWVLLQEVIEGTKAGLSRHPLVAILSSLHPDALAEELERQTDPTNVVNALIKTAHQAGTRAGDILPKGDR